MPELPIEDVELEFFDQARSFLTSPMGCGDHQTTSRLTPWSAPEGADRNPSDSFRIEAGASGLAGCPRSEAGAPLQPTLSAGTATPRAGSFQPFVLWLGRGDGTQRLGAIEATLPSGLTTKIAGIPACGDGAIGAGTCPADTKVGSVDIGAGSGPLPLHIPGGVYLAGPYKGAPLSLEVLAPAVAGPFDLGTVAVRIGLNVDPRTARIRAVSDPLPTILKGIPLDLRSITVTLDRPGFVRTPTSCNPQSVAAAVTSPLGREAVLSDRFQVGGCARLRFKPRVSVRLLGSGRRGAHSKLRAVVRSQSDEANLRRVSVTLPAKQLLDFRRIRAICGADVLAAGGCPANAKVGWLKAWTPLLGEPLEGPVTLVASDRRLPSLAAQLRGRIDLEMRAGIDAVGGRLRVSLANLPERPGLQTGPNAGWREARSSGQRGRYLREGGEKRRRPPSAERAGAFLEAAAQGQLRRIEPRNWYASDPVFSTSKSVWAFVT